MNFWQAEAGYFDFTAFGPADFEADLTDPEAPFLDFDGFDWPATACLSEVAEPVHAETTSPLLPTDISLEVLHPASRVSQRPRTLQQPYGTQSHAAPQETAQNVQQSSYAELPTRGPCIGPCHMHELSASCWAGNATLSHRATSIDPGPKPMPGGVATIEWQPASELSLPGQTHYQPAGWQTATGWPSHGAPAAKPAGRPRHYKKCADRMPSTPAGLSEELTNLPAASGEFNSASHLNIFDGAGVLGGRPLAQVALVMSELT